MKNLYFDIETVRGDIKLDINDFKAPANIKDEAKILAVKQKKMQEAYDKAGLNSFTAKVCCIGYAFNDEPVNYIAGVNEIEVLTEFSNIITQYLGADKDLITWVGHNIIGFDLPFIYHRAIKYDLKMLKAYLPETNRSSFIVDTMDLCNPFEWKPKISLDKACKYFGIPTPKGGIDGSQVQGVYDAGGLDDIGKYCSRDVEAVRELYLKLK